MMEHLESDLHIASFLLARGFTFLGMEPVGTRYAFKFEASNGEVATATQEYIKGALIPAREFAAAIQQLKGALYAAKFSKQGKGNGNEQHYYKQS